PAQSAEPGNNRRGHHPFRDLLPRGAVLRRLVEYRLRDHLQPEELHFLGAAAVAHQGGDDDRHLPHASAGDLHLLQGPCRSPREADRMSSELITLFMFSTMVVLLVTGQRVFGVIGFVGSAAALWLWGQGS